MFHPNSNKRFRLRGRLMCTILLRRDYHDGVPTKTQTKNNGGKPYELKIEGPSGKTAIFDAVHMKSPTGEEVKLVRHYGVAPEHLSYVILFS